MSKDIVAKTGEYTDREGNVKGEWTKIGVILSGQNGDYILLDPAVNLAGVLAKQNMAAIERRKAGDEKARTGKAVMCSIFDRDQQQGGQKTGDDAVPPANEMYDDDIPF